MFEQENTPPYTVTHYQHGKPSIQITFANNAELNEYLSGVPWTSIIGARPEIFHLMTPVTDDNAIGKINRHITEEHIQP